MLVDGYNFAQLWDVYTIQQTSSKLPANVFKIQVLMLDVCWKFARSLLYVCCYML